MFLEYLTEAPTKGVVSSVRLRTRTFSSSAKSNLRPSRLKKWDFGNPIQPHAQWTIHSKSAIDKYQGKYTLEASRSPRRHPSLAASSFQSKPVSLSTLLTRSKVIKIERDAMNLDTSSKSHRTLVAPVCERNTAPASQTVCTSVSNCPKKQLICI